ncbi:DMT family transporter [Amaricoccus macauensis]|uniref:DMT family transporter n=1 Tax=Amaricoccus macauensis TaxID=57001 RepID=UPI003C7E0B07
MDWRALSLGFLFAAAWSSAFTSARIVVADAPPFLALSVRFLISGLIALGIGFALGQRIRLDRRAWGGVILFGVCQNALYLGLNFEAMRTVEASLASVIASMMPLIVAALGRLTGERLSRQAGLGLVAGFAGVLIIMGGRLGQGADLLGMILCLIGVLSLAIATMLVRGVSVGGNLWMVVGLQMLVGSAALFPVSLALETWVVNWSWPLVVAFSYTVLIPGLGATMIWFVLVGMIGATRAATFHFLNPFLGVATAALILGEQVGLRDVLGVAVIMAGILAVQTARR